MSLISADDRAYLIDRYRQELENPVVIEFFTRGDLPTSTDLDEMPDPTEPDVSQACQITAQLLAELAETSPKITIEQYEVDTEAGHKAALASDVNPQLLPALRYRSEGLTGNVVFYGMPIGFEFGTLIEAVSDFSRGVSGLGKATQQKVTAITTPLEIIVFVTPTCSFCPDAVRMANQSAMLNPNLSVSVVEANEFSELADSYYLYGVPKTVINDQISFDGAVPEHIFVANLERAIKAAKSMGAELESKVQSN